jgi:hypothetical protein
LGADERRDETHGGEKSSGQEGGLGHEERIEHQYPTRYKRIVAPGWEGYA